MRVEIVIQGYSDTRVPGYLETKSGVKLYSGKETGHGYVEGNGYRSYFESARRAGSNHWIVSFLDDVVRYNIFGNLSDSSCARKIFQLQDEIGATIPHGVGTRLVVYI